MFFRVRTRNKLYYPTRRRREKSETDVIKNTYVTVQKVLDQKEKKKKKHHGGIGGAAAVKAIIMDFRYALAPYTLLRGVARENRLHISNFPADAPATCPPSDGGVHWGGCRGTFLWIHIFKIPVVSPFLNGITFPPPFLGTFLLRLSCARPAGRNPEM